MQIKWSWGPALLILSRVLLMHKLWTLPLKVMGNKREAGAHWNCSMWYGILWWKWVHNYLLRISSPQGNRRVAPMQPSIYPMGPLSLVCHLLVWPVQYTLYTWSWNQAWGGQRYHLHFLWTQLNDHHRKWEFVLRPLRPMAQGPLPDF